MTKNDYFHITRQRTAFVLLGASCAGKSTWSREHFPEEQILSLDKCRELLDGELEWHQHVHAPAADLQKALIHIHSRKGNAIVIDGKNLDGKYRRELCGILRSEGYVIVYVKFDDTLDVDELVRREEKRRLRDAIRQPIARKVMERDARRYEGLNNLEQEADYVIDSTYSIHRNPQNVIHSESEVLFIGDVHDNYEKVERLLVNHGYLFFDDGTVSAESDYSPLVVFVGDLVDRGPDPIRMVRMVKSLVNNDMAVCVRGNHDDTCAKLMNTGQRTKSSPNTIKTVKHFDEHLSEAEFEEFRKFFNSLPYCIVVNGVFVSHAGIRFRENVPWDLPLLPNKGETQLMLRGWKTGERNKRGYQKLEHPGNLNSLRSPMQVFGHVNSSDEDGGEFTVPHVIGNAIGLESHIEDGPEYGVGWFLMKPDGSGIGGTGNKETTFIGEWSETII